MVALFWIVGCGSGATSAESNTGAASAHGAQSATATSASTAPGPSGRPAPTAGCRITAGAAESIPLHRDLQAVAPQYFHASARDGFNYLPPGSKTYTWFDPHDLGQGVAPPGDMSIIVRATRSHLFGRASDGASRFARRGDNRAHPFPGDVSLWMLDAIATGAGDSWLLGRDNAGLVLARVGKDGGATITPWPGIKAAGRDDAAIVETAAGAAVAWVERSGATLRVKARWLNDDAEPRVIDEVHLPAAAELSAYTGFDLIAVAHGQSGLAVAWRPLLEPADGNTIDAGSRSTPPTTPAAAEIRIVATTSTGSTGTTQRHQTRAMPLMGTTGIGPWPLAGNGMAGGRFGAEALFVWLEDGAILGARPSDNRPVKLAPSPGAPRLLPWLRADGSLDLLTFHSVDGARRIPVRCSEPG